MNESHAENISKCCKIAKENSINQIKSFFWPSLELIKAKTHSHIPNFRIILKTDTKKCGTSNHPKGRKEFLKF